MRLRARVTTLTIVVALVAGVSVGCAADAPTAAPSTSASARPLTTDEAQLLAMMRFRNFDEGARAVRFSVAEGDRELTFDGWVDYTVGTGYGALSTSDADAVLQWSADAVALRPAEEAFADAVTAADQTLGPEWTASTLDPGSSRLHSLLAVIVALGADRPENPLLLQQTGALAIGHATRDGESLSVFAGPPSDEVREPGAPADPDESQVRYWLDDEGVVQRLQVRLGGGSEWSQVDFGAADDVSLIDPFAEVSP